MVKAGVVMASGIVVDNGDNSTVTNNSYFTINMFF